MALTLVVVAAAGHIQRYPVFLSHQVRRLRMELALVEVWEVLVVIPGLMQRTSQPVSQAPSVQALKEVLEPRVPLAGQEGKLGKGSVWSATGGLAVILDDQGGFCMEFCDQPEEGDLAFVHAEVPNVRFFVSVLALGRIGGATVDMREGRFKLDLPEDECACSPHNCACSEIEN